VIEYFNAIELFSSFLSLTSAVDEVLTNNDNQFYFRELVTDDFLENLCQKILLNYVVSLEAHEKTLF
jgi:hypothetical protein